jgi:hypothetical protein
MANLRTNRMSPINKKQQKGDDHSYYKWKTLAQKIVSSKSESYTLKNDV